jgi:hypothetical protein
MNVGKMDLEPRSLGAALNPPNRFWAKAVGAVALVALALLFVAPRYGIPFTAAVLVAFPPLALWIFSHKVHDRVGSQGWPVRVGILLLLLVYIGLAKRHVVPALTGWLGSVLA